MRGHWSHPTAAEPIQASQASPPEGGGAAAAAAATNFWGEGGSGTSHVPYYAPNLRSLGSQESEAGARCYQKPSISGHRPTDTTTTKNAPTEIFHSQKSYKTDSGKPNTSVFQWKELQLALHRHPLDVKDFTVCDDAASNSVGAESVAGS